MLPDIPTDHDPFVLKLSCEDRPGIVAGVASTLAALGCNILESAQFDDLETGLFFMRVLFAAPKAVTAATIRGALGPTTERFHMTWDLIDARRKARVLVMVSKFDHCLQDLLYRSKVGDLPIDIVAIISNHTDSAATADHNGIPYYHWPVTPETKPEAEARLLALVEELQGDLVVLARYMQILSDEVSTRLFGRVINIHHSFLPAFKGARPYQQAHARGVKLIGATAHYVTPDLDEGPIIEQDAERVSHSQSVSELVHIGQRIEARVLTRAVRYHTEQRVFLNGIKTVVFQ